jgi:hypothetical protein
MTRRLLLRITLLSAYILFLEMLLVRWVGTELRVFAYLQNGVLVAAFLGLGLGARSARAPVRLLPSVLALTAVAFVIRDPGDWGLRECLSQGLVAFQDSVIWYGHLDQWPTFLRTALVGFALILSLALLAGLAWTFRPLGQWLGAWMGECERPIAAYTANILGSLLGVAAFTAATIALFSPRWWLIVAGVGLALLTPLAIDTRPARAAAFGLAVALPLFAWGEPTPTVWSPYQKLSVQPIPGGQGCGEVISVNGVDYQAMVDLDPERMAAFPNLYPAEKIRTSQYILPYEILGRRERVLVAGAGAGNDVSAALRADAAVVRAVEIDPAIVEIGRSRHPNRPYRSERVSVVVDDARAFFGRDDGR